MCHEIQPGSEGFGDIWQAAGGGGNVVAGMAAFGDRGREEKGLSRETLRRGRSCTESVDTTRLRGLQVRGPAMGPGVAIGLRRCCGPETVVSWSATGFRWLALMRLPGRLWCPQLRKQDFGRRAMRRGLWHGTGGRGGVLHCGIGVDPNADGHSN